MFKSKGICKATKNDATCVTGDGQGEDCLSRIWSYLSQVWNYLMNGSYPTCARLSHALFADSEDSAYRLAD